MSETMYDKLGDLLNDTLKNGQVQFLSQKQLEEEKIALELKEKQRLEEEKQRAEEVLRKKEEERRQAEIEAAMKAEAMKLSARKFVLFPENVLKAFKLLKLKPTCDSNQIKKAYKERLKYFHPDNYVGNQILTKIANEKTAQIVEAYRLIDSYLSKLQ